MESYSLIDSGLLEQGEEILWYEKPNIKLFHICDIILIPFQLLVFGSIMYFSSLFILKQHIFSIEFVFILVFFLLSVYGVFGRTIGKVITQSKTTYYLTNKRAIIVKNLKKTVIRSKYFNSMKMINYKVKKNGRSRVVFDFSPLLTPLYANSGNSAEKFMSGASLYGQLPPAFYNLNAEDAEEVYNLALELRNKERN